MLTTEIAYTIDGRYRVVRHEDTQGRGYYAVQRRNHRRIHVLHSSQSVEGCVETMEMAYRDHYLN